MNIEQEIYTGSINQFDVNYDGFSKLTEILHMMIETSNNHWFKVTKEQVRDYLASAFEIYAVLNLHRFRFNIGINDSGIELMREHAQYITIPRYFRDVFREMTRPMSDGGNIYIPKIKPCDSRDFFTTYNINREDIFKMSQIFAKLDFEVVSIETEVIKTLPLSQYHSERQVIVSVSVIPDFRWKALSLLKHCVFKEREFNTESTIAINAFKDLFSNLTITENISTVNERGQVVIGSRPMFTQNLWYLFLPSYLNNQTRFPTEDSHSTSPPGTPKKPKPPKKKDKSKQKDDQGNKDTEIDGKTSNQ